MLRDYAFRAVYPCGVRARARVFTLCRRAFSRCVAGRFLAVAPGAFSLWAGRFLAVQWMSPYAGKKHRNSALIRNFNLVCSECCAIGRCQAALSRFWVVLLLMATWARGVLTVGGLLNRPGFFW